MLTSLASPEGYVQSTSESPAPTPPPKDYPDSLIKFSANNHGTYRTTTPNGLGHIDASEDSYFALGHNRRPSGPYLSPRPALRLGSSFARPAPPTLTITPISAPVPSFVRGRASERSSTVAAHAALKAASTASNRSAKALPQRPSLPNFKKSDYESMASDSESEEFQTAEGEPASSTAHDAATTSHPKVHLSYSASSDAHYDTATPKLNRTMLRCVHAMLELIDSELAFVADLRLLLSYTQAASIDLDLALTDAQSSTFASLNIAELLRIHESLSYHLDLLKSSIPSPFGDNDIDPNEVFSSLLSVSQAFDEFDLNASVYETYCGGHGEVVDILRSVQHKPEYIAFEQRSALRDSSKNVERQSNSQKSGPSTASRRQTFMTRYAPRSEPGHGGNDETHPDEFGAALDVKTVGRAKSSASLSSRPSFKSFRRSLRRSPAPTRQSSRPPSPIPSPISQSNSLPEPPVTPIESASDHTTFLESSFLRPLDDHIPPVPPIPASALIPNEPPLSISQPCASKPLAFRDLLIKPIQRVCRYPLLLAQLRLPSSVPRSKAMAQLEIAIKATHLVATKVDRAQELREVARKSALIIERLESHLLVTPEFVKELGHCALSSSVEALLHYPEGFITSHTPRVKYVAAFLYRGYMILAKVRKNQTYRAWHWFPLSSSAVEATADDATQPNSFIIRVGGYGMELTASCQDERIIWMKTVIMASQDPPTAMFPKSSLQLLDEAGTASGASSGALTPKKRQSFFATNPPLSAAATAPVASRPESYPNPTPTDLTTFGSTAKTPNTIKRLSTASLVSIFGADQVSSPTTITPRRSTAATRLLVDRNMRDVTSDICLSARAQAQVQGELFPALVPTRVRTMSSVSVRQHSSSSINATPHKRQTFDQMDSFGLARMSEESQTSKTASGRRRSSSSPTAHRRARSMPGADTAAQPPHPSELPLPPLDLSESANVVSRRRGVFDLVDREIEAKNLDAGSASKDGSEDGFGDSGWERDEVSSPVNTDLSSVETHRSVQAKPGNEVSSSKAFPAKEDSLPNEDNAVVLDEEDCVVTLLGKGLTNAPPERNRSLFRKSLLALSRRRARSSPSPKPASPSPTRETFALHTVPPVAEDGRLLSPHWISSSRRGRSPAGIRSLPAESTGDDTSNSLTRRGARG